MKQMYCLQNLVWPAVVHRQKLFTLCFTVTLKIISNPVISQVCYECLTHVKRKECFIY